MVKRTPRIPPSAQSMAAKLAPPPTLIARYAALLQRLDDLYEEFDRIEIEAGRGRPVAAVLNQASTQASQSLCALAPTNDVDRQIVAGFAMGIAEYVSESVAEGCLSPAANAAFEALRGIHASLEVAA